jgi:DNA invertase Pin-like site-specific DNA recombinase
MSRCVTSTHITQTCTTVMSTGNFVLGGLAEFERELIRTKTGEGRARAKARGKKLGRTYKLALP